MSGTKRAAQAAFDAEALRAFLKDWAGTGQSIL